MTSISTPSRRRSDPALQPWSHRQPYALRILITIASGVAVGVIGTLAHRMGAAQNIPYGLLLAFLLLGISTWCARARSNAVGLGFHLIASSAAVWMLTGYGPGGDALVPIGFSGEVPFFCQRAGVIWIYGVIVLQVVMLFLPARWFMVPDRLAPGPETVDVAETFAADGSDDGEGERP
ncbi:hypothetical protein [Bifidobacterium pullorum]|uniref:hypothetical protein n=1 Tax=Bifidobacterium pullorum TaxID=78448 RepID=UPI0009DE09AB|nr:hypothetical protein [Bifidobacterium pullorum]